MGRSIRPGAARGSFLGSMLLALAVAAGGVGTACKTDGAKAGAGAARSAPATATIETTERPLSFRVELAITRDEQARGLMYRQHLDADAGMLFINDAPSPLVFWMKNTLIPLDMIFIGSDRRIVGIVENAEPQTETPRRVEGLSQYVLEIGGGLSAKLGIRAGQQVSFQGIPSP